jgi:hypothetical protein
MLPEIDDPLWRLLTSAQRKSLEERLSAIDAVCQFVENRFSTSCDDRELRATLEEAALDLTTALDEELDDQEGMSSWRFFAGWTSAIRADADIVESDLKCIDLCWPSLAVGRRPMILWLVEVARSAHAKVAALEHEVDAPRAIATISLIEVLSRLLHAGLLRALLTITLSGE